MAHQVNVAELFSLLESGKPNEVEEVKTLIHENLNATKETWLLNGLVDYYMLTQSSRCLDILVGIREPHDKHLFDKLSDCLKGQTRRNSLLLLSHLIRKQPSWLYKIIQHRVMNTFLSILKTDTDVPNLLSALLTLVTLLPLLPAMFGPLLQDVFEIFSRLASWNSRKPANIPDVFLLHLHVGVYALFHRLYALYPCNFLAYLRSYYGARDNSRENLHTFIGTIKPMLERVRLHPLLVTASKDTELSMTRWRKMETHDIIVDCAKVSLDAIEGIREDLSQRIFNVSSSSLPILTTHLLSSDYMHCLSNTGHSGRAPFTFEDGSLVRKVTRLSQVSNSGSFVSKDATQSMLVPLWSPSRACGLETPPPLQPHVSPMVSVEVENQSLQGTSGSPPDIAQEALPESSPPKTKENIISSTISQSSNELISTDSSASLLHSISLSGTLSLDAKPAASKSDASSTSMAQQEMDVTSKIDGLIESTEAVPLPNESSINNSGFNIPKDGENSSLNLGSLPWGTQDKTDSLTTENREDNEVSEIVGCLTTSSQAECTQEPGHMTPFYSTTCYLTAAPDEDSPSSDVNNRGDLVNESPAVDDASSSLVQQFVHNINRLRYFSQCTPQLSDIPIECSRPFPNLRRSRSCPSNVSELARAANSGVGEKLDSPGARHHSEATSSVCLTTSTFSTVSVDTRTEVLSVVSTSESLISGTAVASSTVCVKQHAASENVQQSTELGRSSPPSLTSSTVGDQSGSLTSFMSGDLTKTVSSVGHSVHMTYPQPWPCAEAATGHNTPSFSSLSPLEVLDRHLQLGNDVYLKELRGLPLTSTKDIDWTHFGGNAPPDEVNILRGQISLLHSQLLYERYKREIHAERNRRLLGRAKKSRALEEQNSAMKDQLQLQEEEILKISQELARFKTKHAILEKEKKMECENLDKRIRELTEKNEELHALALKNETLLAISNQEQDELRKLLQEVQSKLFETTQELKTYQQQANRSQQLAEEVDHVNRQLMLLGELYHQCRQKLEVTRPLRSVSQEQEIMKEAWQAEIAGLKQLVDSRNAQLDSLRARAESLEVSVAEKDLAMKELKQLFETVKDKHRHQIQAERDRNACLLKICQQQEVYLMEAQEHLTAKERNQAKLSPEQDNPSNGESSEQDTLNSQQQQQPCTATCTEPPIENSHSQSSNAVTNSQPQSSVVLESSADIKLPFANEMPSAAAQGKVVKTAERTVFATPATKIDSFRNLELLLDKGDESEVACGRADSQMFSIAADADS